ncbi:putative FBD-associated F-box protein At5g56560 [Brassica napus]|uniref:putative FBD-associated F-box protein At5g56560 n=1 Tax=Brassica napus TaxID=3708 RepID=UPI002078E605|nr:putative FBD-associated F-box protein At5g56560 [Brassica napus]
MSMYLSELYKRVGGTCPRTNHCRSAPGQLPDDLLLRILSSLSLKEVMATSFLSQRWRSLWKLGSKLKIGDKDFDDFLLKWVSRSLAISNPQILKSLDLKLIPGNECDRNSNSFHRFSSLVETTVSCGLRELRIEFLYTSLELPSIFYACGTLETLILCRLHLVDVPPNGSLSSLKTLRLLSVKFSRDESVQKLLSICPVLEELVVRRSGYSNVEIFTINVPSLTSLSIDYIRVGSHQPTGVHGFVINAPSLRYLNIRDRHSNYLLFTNMPELVKANVEAVCDQSESLIGSLASVRYLSLCSKSSNIPYHAGTSFAFLEHLELCTCSSECCNLLSRIITDPLTLRVLKLKSVCSIQFP